jgi:hypothetical protein
MKLHQRVAFGALLVALTSRSSGAQSPRTPTQVCALRDSLARNTPRASGDDLFDIVARVLPGGFGGLTTTYFFLKQPALADSARAIARTLAACTEPDGRRLWEIVERAEVRQGQYDWIELRRWYAQLLTVESAGWNSADIDEGANRLSYKFATSAKLEIFRRRAEALGIPGSALVLKVDNGVR